MLTACAEQEHLKNIKKHTKTFLELEVVKKIPAISSRRKKSEKIGTDADTTEAKKTRTFSVRNFVLLTSLTTPFKTVSGKENGEPSPKGGDTRPG